jgi:large subunit ribosomal protein L3
MNQNLGILGKKLGMTQIFTPDGSVIRCTVIDTNAVIVGKRTLEKDGYSALVFGFDDEKEKHASKAKIGSFKKAGMPLKKMIREMRVPPETAAKFEMGAKVSLPDFFEEGQFVDVQGTTRGRGFTGVVRRWSFAGFTRTHGTHEYRRHGGSIGTNMTPGRTLPNLKMPGQYGSETVSVLNVKVARIMADKGLLLIDGGVPGAKNSFVFVRGAVKKKNAGKKKALSAASFGKHHAPRGRCPRRAGASWLLCSGLPPPHPAGPCSRCCWSWSPRSPTRRGTYWPSGPLPARISCCSTRSGRWRSGSRSPSGWRWWPAPRLPRARLTYAARLWHQEPPASPPPLAGQISRPEPTAPGRSGDLACRNPSATPSGAPA